MAKYSACCAERERERERVCLHAWVGVGVCVFLFPPKIYAESAYMDVINRGLCHEENTDKQYFVAFL